MNHEMMIYYSVVNLIDWYVAKADIKNLESVKQILTMLEEITGISPAEVGEANDCGVCDTWDDVIKGFEELTQSGERIPA